MFTYSIEELVHSLFTVFSEDLKTLQYFPVFLNRIFFSDTWRDCKSSQLLSYSVSSEEGEKENNQS